jgi:hypothetical protein
MTHTRIFYRTEGDHVVTEWFSAKAHGATHAKNGDLKFSIEEWKSIFAVLVRFRALFEINEK